MEASTGNTRRCDALEEWEARGDVLDGEALTVILKSPWPWAEVARRSPEELEWGMARGMEEERRGTTSMLLEVQCEVFTVSNDLGCRIICWCWSTVFSEVHSQRRHLPGNFRALHASFCWQALWRCWFHFPAGLGTYPHCQRYQKLVQRSWCYCAWLASKLAWPEPHREYMGCCQEKDEGHHNQQMQTTRRPLSKQPGLPLHLSSATGRLPPCHATLMQ